jgi:hypothetical protein
LFYVNIGFLYHDSPVIITGNSFFNYMLRSFINVVSDLQQVSVFLWILLLVTCSRSVFFSGYSCLSHQYRFLYHDSPVIITGNSFFNYMLRSFIISSDDFKMIPNSYNKDIDNILSAYVTFLENLFTYLRRHQCLCFLLYRHYTYIVGKIWKLFCPVLQRVQVNLIFSNNVRLLCFFCNVKKYKTSAKMSKISILI